MAILPRVRQADGPGKDAGGPRPMQPTPVRLEVDRERARETGGQTLVCGMVAQTSMVRFVSMSGGGFGGVEARRTWED